MGQQNNKTKTQESFKINMIFFEKFNLGEKGQMNKNKKQGAMVFGKPHMCKSGILSGPSSFM